GNEPPATQCDRHGSSAGAQGVRSQSAGDNSSTAVPFEQVESPFDPGRHDRCGAQRRRPCEAGLDSPRGRELRGRCGPPPPRARVDGDRLAAMSATLAHRGPDSEGVFVDGGVGLAARRLAIIDLDSGDQPISNEDGTATVVQNGELYNYRELTRELERAGHRF